MTQWKRRQIILIKDFLGIEIHNIKSQEIKAKWCHATCKPVQIQGGAIVQDLPNTYCDVTWRACQAHTSKLLHDSRVLLLTWKGAKENVLFAKAWVNNTEIDLACHLNHLTNCSLENAIKSPLIHWNDTIMKREKLLSICLPATNTASAAAALKPIISAGPLTVLLEIWTWLMD